jgi:hypothetical protein
MVKAIAPQMDAYIERRLRQFRAQGVRRVKAQSSGRRDECAICRALNGIIYPIDEFPEYPPPGCQCEVGCGCIAVGVVEEPTSTPSVDLQVPYGDRTDANIPVTEHAEPNRPAGLIS